MGHQHEKEVIHDQGKGHSEKGHENPGGKDEQASGSSHDGGHG